MRYDENNREENSPLVRALDDVPRREQVVVIEVLEKVVVVMIHVNEQRHSVLSGVGQGDTPHGQVDGPLVHHAGLMQSD